MPVSVTMKDALVVEMVDESFNDFCAALNLSMQKGMQFIGVDGMNGEKIMLNIPNIQVAHEMDED